MTMRRPDHPDLLRLLDLVNELDDTVDAETDRDAKDRVFRMLVEGRVDPQSVAYVGSQRALRAFQVPDSVKGLVDNLAEVSRGTTLWMEGVVVGVELERRRRARQEGR